VGVEVPARAVVRHRFPLSLVPSPSSLSAASAATHFNPLAAQALGGFSCLGATSKLANRLRSSSPYLPNHAQYPPRASSRSMSHSTWPNDERESTAALERIADGPNSESPKSPDQISLCQLIIAFLSPLSLIPGVWPFFREFRIGGAGLVLSRSSGLQRSQHGTVGSVVTRGKFPSYPQKKITTNLAFHSHRSFVGPFFDTQ